MFEPIQKQQTVPEVMRAAGVFVTALIMLLAIGEREVLWLGLAADFIGVVIGLILTRAPITVALSYIPGHQNHHVDPDEENRWAA